MQLFNLLSAIQFDPHIRGILVVLTGVVALCGTTYLLVATNTGLRAGFLICAAAFFGWMFLMGIIWWTYGIGLRGKDPSWVGKEVNYSRESQNDQTKVAELGKLPIESAMPDPALVYRAYIADRPAVGDKIESAEGEGWRPSSLTQLYTQVVGANVSLGKSDDALAFAYWLEDGKDSGQGWESAAESNGNWGGFGGWIMLSEADPRRGEAVASSDAMLITGKAFGDPTETTMYTVKDVFIYGGKELGRPELVEGEYSMFERAWRRVASAFQFKNPPTYAAVTMRGNLEQVVGPGEAPPPAKIDPEGSMVTSVMMRNLGNRRLIPALFTIFNAVLFACFAYMLHNRDKAAMAARAAWDPKKAAKATSGAG